MSATPVNFANMKTDPMDCGATSPPATSMSPKSTDENASQYTATSSPSSITNHNSVGSTIIGNHTGNGNLTFNNQNATMSVGSSSNSSAGAATLESPRSSNDTSQRTSFDFNSMFGLPSMNNNNSEKSCALGDLGLPSFALGQSNGLGSNTFPGGFPLPSMESNTSFPLAQILGGNPFLQNFVRLMQSQPFKPNLDPFFCEELGTSAHQQLNKTNRQHRNGTASRQQKPSLLPDFQNVGAGTIIGSNSCTNSGHVDGDRAPSQSNETPQERQKQRTYPYTFQFCVLCSKNVHSSKLPCHIRQMHISKPMFRCPACDFTSTYSKNNVKSHMVSLHNLATEPISYMEQYAPQVEEYMKQCFPNVRGRGRPVHGRRSLRSPASNPVQTSTHGPFSQTTRAPSANGQLRKILNIDEIATKLNFIQNSLCGQFTHNPFSNNDFKTTEQDRTSNPDVTLVPISVAKELSSPPSMCNPNRGKMSVNIVIDSAGGEDVDSTLNDVQQVLQTFLQSYYEKIGQDSRPSINLLNINSQDRTVLESVTNVPVDSFNSQLSTMIGKAKRANDLQQKEISATCEGQ
ncbi:hypothetical protein M3Y96_00920300 [Aphelenchoides besseyi]|nr:hypothetical protein M3Y96_00920300 [Aphelenchoides besseyi]